LLTKYFINKNFTLKRLEWATFSRRFLMKKDIESGFFIGLYRRNETFLLLSAILLFGSMLIGYFLAGVLDQYLSGRLQEFHRQITEGTVQLTTSSIFSNNLLVASLIYVSGIFVGLGSAYFLLSQGLFTGYVASKFYLPTFLIYTVPHGIFEIPAIIIAGAAGFRLASGVYHFLKGLTKIKDSIPISSQLGYLVEANADEFIDSLKLFAIAVVLLIIAAIIEANFTIAWGNYIRSII